MWVFWQHGIASAMKTAGVCAVVVAGGDTAELDTAVMCPAMIFALLSACLGCYFENVVNYPKGWFFKYLLNRGRDDSLENGGMQELMDYAWWAFWWLSVGVVFLCGNNLWHIEEFEHWSLTFMVNYSYSGAVLEETKMHCSSETVVPIWDFECERALLNLGFARSFKVSRFDNILFLFSFISEN